MSANGNDNDNDNASNIIFTIKDTKAYVPIVTLSARDNKKRLKLLGKGFGKISLFEWIWNKKWE